MNEEAINHLFLFLFTILPPPRMVHQEHAMMETTKRFQLHNRSLNTRLLSFCLFFTANNMSDKASQDLMAYIRKHPEVLSLLPKGQSEELDALCKQFADKLAFDPTFMMEHSAATGTLSQASRVTC
jgi:hypothetical protein